jgi:methionyl-tRNA formyltransferase
VPIEAIANQLGRYVHLQVGQELRANLQLINQKGEPDPLEIKVISTKVSTSHDKPGDENEILFSGSSLLVPCSQSTWLEVRTLSC